MDNINNIAVGKITYSPDFKSEDTVTNLTSGTWSTWCTVPQAKVFRIRPKAKLPTKATPNSVGYDLYSTADCTILPGQTVKIPTGLVIKPPTGYYCKIYARSGLGSKYDIGIPHGVGVIDPDFCGSNDEIFVVLHRAVSVAKDSYVIRIGDRIGQLVFERVNDVDIEETSLEYLDNIQSRGGFGSSGK